MTTTQTLTEKKTAAHRLHATFLVILPRIKRHGRVCFRDVKCADKKADCIAEMLALCWRWCLRLVEQGKDPLEFPSALASFAARAVRAGRRLCGQEKSRDVLSPLAQQRRNFVVVSLPQRSTLDGNVFDEALQDNTQTPVPEQVSFRIDFPTWLTTCTERDKRMAEDLMVGERTMDVANKYGISPGRISQLRRQLHEDWLRFTDADEQLADQPQAAIA